MDKRLELHELLCSIVNITEPDGDRHVYYQPPESFKIKYPSVIYYRSNIVNSHANNSIYKQSFSYELTVIDEDPDSEIVKLISALPRCRFNRHYTSDNLNHDVFTIYY